MPKKPWGGKRDNQTGRPHIESERQADHTISMTPTRWKIVDRIGRGNLSRGVRKLLDFWRDNSGYGRNSLCYMGCFCVFCYTLYMVYTVEQTYPMEATETESIEERMDASQYTRQEFLMKCPECERSGDKSTLSIGASLTTAMYTQDYYDEEGVLHRHDPNRHETEYSCSNGHSFKKIHKLKCPALECEWNKERSMSEE